MNTIEETVSHLIKKHANDKRGVKFEQVTGIHASLKEACDGLIGSIWYDYSLNKEFMMEEQKIKYWIEVVLKVASELEKRKI